MFSLAIIYELVYEMIEDCIYLRKKNDLFHLIRSRCFFFLRNYY